MTDDGLAKSRTARRTTTQASGGPRRLTLSQQAPRGRGRVRISQLTNGKALPPGRYRVLLRGRRSDGSLSQIVAVKFIVLK